MSDEEYDSDASIASDFGLLKKALPFDCTIPDDFDPNKIPQTAEEYLQYTCYERSLLKPWCTAEIDRSVLTKNDFYELKLEKLDNSVSSEFLPTKEWQERKLAEFIEFRNFIQSRMKPSSKSIISKKDLKEGMLKESPNYETLLKFSQVDKIKVVETIVDQLELIENGSSFDFNDGCWIYAILSLLDIAMCADDFYFVRCIAKRCITLRSNYKSSDKRDYDSFNLFICIVSKFFHQLDLSDP